jgi:hypothetical protein
MITGKILLVFAVGVVAAIAAALHFHGHGLMRALGHFLHGGQ